MRSRDRLNQYYMNLETASGLSDCMSSEMSFRYRIIINTSTFPVDKNTTYFLRIIIHGSLMKQSVICTQTKFVLPE